MSYRLVLSDAAKDDLADIWTFYARQSEDRAQQIVDDILKQAQTLEDYPLLGRNRDDLHPGTRALLVGRGYLLLYTLENQVNQIVFVRRVLHGSRDVESAFGLE